ncbi:hypothetical protein GSS87_03565 [Corynebacterium sp. 4HC-13]|uniref:hypothetical protein n=1 Tax=Corynebacterium anserum TaxID=2684406 RepID=UPI00163A9043|nr:hypothetical protein [Corynebacterium anserum]MBC2681480.1 hypothetical protein [Corynebacterium anserum]
MQSKKKVVSALLLATATALTTPQASAADQTENAVIAAANRAAAAAKQPPASKLATISQSDSNTSQLNIFGDISAHVEGRPYAPGVIANTNGNSVVAQQIDADNLRLSQVIPSAENDSSFTINFKNAGEITDLGNSGFVVKDRQGEPVAQALNPWARDAAGNRIPTHYEIHGNAVTQVVETSAATEYPVTIDPTFRRWKFIIPEIYFNHEETGRARNPAVIEGMIAGACAAFAAATLGTACAVGAAEAAGIAAVASNSYGDGKCMVLRAGLVPATVECS